MSTAQNQALEEIFFLTHIAFGISYYKAFLPKQLVVESGVLSRKQASFFDKLYLNGLGEFSVKNDVDLDISFPFGDKVERPVSIDLKNRSLVPLGGGKDSCVTVELLKQLKREIALISVGNPAPIQKCADQSGVDSHFVIRRQLDKKLLELNKTGRVLNGHVPISGILAFVLWASAILYDYQYVVMSCEQSADIGNLTRKGLPINHQYSKSSEFESDFASVTADITPDFCYFSLLRPISEIHIARLFGKYATHYFDVFTSCNKAFKLDESKRLSHWCADCDKCRFVFLILALYIPKERLIQIFGKNILNDSTQLHGFQELLGVCGHKPFECVGEIDESRFSMYQLINHPQWQNDAVVAYFKSALNKPNGDFFAVSEKHFIPKEFSDVIRYFKV